MEQHQKRRAGGSMINWLSVALVIFGSFLGAIGNILMKKMTAQFPFKEMWKKSRFWLGLVLYGFSVIFYVAALRGERLSVIYPLVTSSYLWTTFFSVRYLREKMNRWKWLALVGIIVGVILVGIGS